MEDLDKGRAVERGAGESFDDQDALGQFTCNRPDKGGLGGNDVRRVIHEANGCDPSVFRIDNFDAATPPAMLDTGFALLPDIAPALFDGGASTAGNAASIQLLAQGAVTMIPAWSDIALQSSSQGVPPETTGLIQLQDLALAGGFFVCPCAMTLCHDFVSGA